MASLRRRTSTAAGWGGWGAGRAAGFRGAVLDSCCYGTLRQDGGENRGAVLSDGRKTTAGQDGPRKDRPHRRASSPYPAAVDVRPGATRRRALNQRRGV